MNQDNQISRVMLKYLNSWSDKPCEIRLETMDKAPILFSMAMQQLSGTVITKKYVDGSFFGAWPFAVYVRFGGVDTGKRLNADAILHALGEWLCNAAELPDLGDKRTAISFEMTSLPAIAAQYDDGGVDYQAVFRLNYRQRSV